MEHFMKRILLTTLLTPTLLLSHGENFEVVKGSASCDTVGNTQTITADDKAIIHFSKFHLSPDERAHFVQPDHKSSVLCRITGKEPSKIRGQLDANGRLFFINPNGIIFGETAQVNVASLIASTLNIHDEDFLNDKHQFYLEADKASKSIINYGHINATQDVVLMAPRLFNRGVITAHTGKIEFLGGELITLSFDEDELISFAIETPLKEGVIEQGGRLIASEVFVKLSTASQLIEKVVNVEGLVEASKIDIQNGIVRLIAGSGIEAERAEIAGHSVENKGDLKVKESLKVEAQKQIAWLKDNTVGDLSLKAPNVVVMGTIDCAELDLKGTDLFQIGADIRAHNSKLVFDAPVSIMTSQLTLSPGEMGGDIIFQKTLNADPRFKDVHLTLNAVGGDVIFNDSVGNHHPLDVLQIDSAHNVSMQEVRVGTLSQKQGSGVTHVAGKLTADEKIDIHAASVFIFKPVVCIDGPIEITSERALTLSENGVIVAKSFHQKGSCPVYLADNITTTEGSIRFEGAVHINSPVDLSAAEGKAPIYFNGTVNGPGELSIVGESCNFSREVGTDIPLLNLSVICSGPITVHDIGNGHQGVHNQLFFKTGSSIHFEGTTYNANSQIYKAEKNFDFLAGRPTKVFGQASILFTDAPLFTSMGTDIAFVTQLGTIHLPPIKASNGHLSISCPQSDIYVSKIEGANRLNIQGKRIALGGSIDVADTVFSGPVSIVIPEDTMTVMAREGNIHFKSTCLGNVFLNLIAPKGTIILDGQLGGFVRGKDPKFKTINLNGKIIDQNKSVNSTSPIFYTADQIYLGGDVNTRNNDIVFNGPVILDTNEAIQVTSGISKGNIIFNSTVDADRPSRALIIENGTAGGAVFFYDGVGTKGALGDLKISTSKLVLSNVGAGSAGVAKHLDVTSRNSVEFWGTICHAGQQTWSTPSISVKGGNRTSFITNGLPMVFTGVTKLNLEPNADLTLKTHGGMLELAKLFGQNHQSVTIDAGQGQAVLGEIEGILDHLQVEGREIVLSGRIDAGSIFMQSEHDIHYKKDNTSSSVNKTSVLSRGDIFLNAKQGMIGEPEYPIHVEAGGELHIGAKSIAYLTGICQGDRPMFYAKNPAPRLYFNRYEHYCPIFEEFSEEEQFLSLSPDLLHPIPGAIVDGSVLKPRKAPIYYEARQ